MKSHLKKINKPYAAVAVVMLFSAFLLLVLTYIKVGMHVDEYLTYGLANNDIYKFSPECEVRLSAAKAFDDYFYADGFNVKNVWQNQGNNVHPPLYYLLFHVFTLVTNHIWALKTGVLLNIIFHIVNIGLIWWILKEILSKDYEAFAGTVLYAFLPIVLGNVLFIRMYVLLTTFILALTLLFVREWDKTNKKAFYIKLGILSLCGALTHYYFLIYLFFCCMIWGIRILIKRRWKELVAFLVTMTIAGAGCLIIFPYILQHVFSGAAGERTFDTLFSTAFLENGKVFFEAINNVYCGFLIAIIIITVMLLVSSYAFKAEKSIKAKDISRWMIIIIPFLLYCLTVTKIAIMPTKRYISPMYGVCIILLMGLFEKLISYVTVNDKVKCIAGILMVGLLLNSGWNIYTWPELYLEAEEGINISKKYGINNECIYVLKARWRGLPNYEEFLQYQSMTFMPVNGIDALYTDEYSGYDHVVMYFDKTMSDTEINSVIQKMIEMNPDLNEYEELYQYSYNIAYYLE